MSLTGTNIDIDLLGTRVRTIVDDLELAGHLRHLLSDLRVPDEPPTEIFEITGGVTQGGDWVLRHNERGTLQTSSRASLVERFFAALNELVLDDFGGIAIHAGVVAQGRGAIAIPGKSGAGKSTLTAACVAAGFSYVSDEALCIDRSTGEVVPYPRPLMLSATSRFLIAPKMQPDGGYVGKRPLSPADIGGRTSSVTLRLADIVMAERGSTLNLEPLSLSIVLPELLERCFEGHGQRAETFELLSTAVRDCRAWRLGYQDALDAAALLRRALPFSQASG
jgi:hypothetical protein